MITRAVLFVPLVLTGCSGHTDIAQILGEPMGFETREHRIERVSQNRVLPVNQKCTSDPADTNGDCKTTIAEEAAYRHMTVQEFESWYRNRTEEDYRKHVRPIDCGNPANWSQDTVCQLGDLGVEISITH